MLHLQNITYVHPNKDVLFEGVNLHLNSQKKAALIGNNGAGKSTLLGIIAGALPYAQGNLERNSDAYYVPQVFGQFNHLTVAQVLGVNDKLQALRAILDGAVSEDNFQTLNDDWTIEERCMEALANWKLEEIALDRSMGTLSGGQKIKVLLAGIFIHQPQFVLMDEPSNHLDSSGRKLLYDFIKQSTATLLVVSHDRALLNLMDTMYELSKNGIATYGGNYDFYTAQKEIEQAALLQDVQGKEKELRKAKEIARAAAERQQKLDARGKKKQDKAGTPTIMMNTLRNNAEKSTARTKEVHAAKTGIIADELSNLRASLPELDKMKFDFDKSILHNGKILFDGKGMQLVYNGMPVWQQPLDVQLLSGDRVAIKGNNGSGKTSLIKVILNQVVPQSGSVHRALNSVVYIDQDYSLIQNEFTVYEQAQQYNKSGLQEHEVKSKLSRFLFTKAFWDKPCASLSGGERMRLALCCITVGNAAPDLIILDEPTNNLDIQNVTILTNAIKDYEGTLLVISHDAYFLEEIGVEREIVL